MGFDEGSMLDFLIYALARFYPDLLPLLSMFLVLAVSVLRAIRKTSYPLFLRLLEISSFALLFVAVGLLVMQPMVQVYLEQELEMIFLEANKYTALMRNLRYLIYPIAMLTLGATIFYGRDEMETERGEYGAD